MSGSRRDREELGGEDPDDEEDVQYGVRRSRRTTSREHRPSSTLTPAQIMEQEVYYESAEEALERSLILAQIIGLLLIMYNHLNRMVGEWFILGNDIVADALAAVRAKMQHIKNGINRLLFLMTWTGSYGEMAFLYAEDLSIFIRRTSRFQPSRYRQLDEIDQQDSYSWFGLNPHDLRRLFISLRIPETFTTPSRHVYTGEECFIIFLYHMEQGTPLTAMARNTFGGDPRCLSKMMDEMIEHLYLTFYNKISGTSLDQWIPRYLDRCRELIHNAISDGAIWETEYINGEVVNEAWILHHFEFQTFRIFGFLDDFALPTARPGNEARRLYRFAHDIQRAFYSGYLRGHGLKAQVVYLPIGLIGSVFITELRQNDNGVQNLSGLNDYLVQLLTGIFINGLFPCLFCDGIFVVLVTILPRFTNPTPEKRLLNIRLASLRECIEHVFADHRNRFKLFEVPHWLHLYSRGVKVRQMSLVSFFILNCYYCIGGTRCRYFGQVPPTLEEYLPLDEVLLPPPAVDLGDVWDYRHSSLN